MSLLDPRSRIDQATDQWRLLHRKLLPGERVRLTVRSGSMLPLLPIGAEIAVAATSGDRCRAGHVVVFRRGDLLVAHRLLYGWGRGACGWFLERGDGVSPIGFIRARSILGLVVEVMDPGGRRQRLDEPMVMSAGLRKARRNMARFLLEKMKAPARKAMRWFRHDSTGCG
jgi:hypothetical protein